MDKLAEAESLCRRSLAIQEKALGQDHPDVADSLDLLKIVTGTSAAPSPSVVDVTPSAPPQPPDLDDEAVPKSSYAAWLHAVAPATFRTQHSLKGWGSVGQLSKKNSRPALVEACRALLSLSSLAH